jgi:phosphoribosyl 1,2-cyclic phosphodiesterase
VRWTVLASGSRGNASLLQLNGFGVLIDVGLGPRQLAQRMQCCGATWQGVHAVLLTHTHADHWNPRTLAYIQRQRIPVYCHDAHVPLLRTRARGWGGAMAPGTIRCYEPERPIALTAGLSCTPLPLAHDGGPTFGFRIEGAADLFHPGWALAYLADLGCWDERLADAIAEVDLLALEFNHDVELQRASGRSAALIARVLGDEGHLSNDQAASLLAAVLRRTTRGRLRQLVQLHLSRDCNRPDLARESARRAASTCDAMLEMHTADQDVASPVFTLEMQSILGGTDNLLSGSRQATRGYSN